MLLPYFRYYDTNKQSPLWLAECGPPEMLTSVEPVTLSPSMEKGSFPEVIKALNLEMERIFWATQADSTSAPESLRAESVSQLWSEGAGPPRQIHLHHPSPSKQSVSQLWSEGAVTTEEAASERCCIAFSEAGQWGHEPWTVGCL